MAEVKTIGNIFNNIVKGIEEGYSMIALQGSARCFAPGTKIRMADGTIKSIEDIKVGDKVFDPFHKRANVVTEIHHGYDTMYCVHHGFDENDKSFDYVVNSKHILTLTALGRFYPIHDNEYYETEDKHGLFNVSVENYLDFKFPLRYKACGVKVENGKLEIINNGIEIKEEGYGEFYGFSLKNSPYFLLENGVLVHNSGKSHNSMIFIIMCCLNPNYVNNLMAKNYAKAMERWQNAVDRGMLVDEEIDANKPEKPLPVTKVRVSIVRDTLPAIKRSIYTDDFVPIMEQMGIWNQKAMNMTEMVYRFPNGSTIEFFGSDGPEGAAKCKGPSRDILFCNEADCLEMENFKHLRMRTRMFTLCDFNPSFTEDHWLYKLLGDWRTYHFISTFRDNPFLTTAIKSEILSYKETAPALWEIYGLGHFAKVEGLVYPKETWDIVDMTDLPVNVKLEERIGIDVGFSGSGDPTAVTLIRTANIDGLKHMWIEELLYEKGLNEKQMAYRLKQYNHIKKYIDSSNPLYIKNLEDNGVQLLFPVKKYANSIVDGITKVQSYKLHIIRGSHNIEREFRNYCWMKDRQGNYTDTPIDKWNHGCDSIRYAVFEDRTARGGHIKSRYTKRELNLGY